MYFSNHYIFYRNISNLHGNTLRPFMARFFQYRQNDDGSKFIYNCSEFCCTYNFRFSVSREHQENKLSIVQSCIDTLQLSS